MNGIADIVTAIATSTVALATLIAGARYLLRTLKHRRACKNHPDEPSNLSTRPTRSWLKSIDCYTEESVMGVAEALAFPKANHISWVARCERCHKEVAKGGYSTAV